MAALFPPSFLPSEGEVILQLLLSAKTHRIAREAVDALVTPRSLMAADGQETGESETLQVLRSTGLVRRDGDDLVFGEAVEERLRETRGSRESLRTLIRRLFLVGAPIEEAGTSNEGARDLARAAAWFLLQDPWTPTSGWRSGWEAIQERQLQAEDYVLMNDTRWGALERWLPYLGLAVHDHRDIGGRGSDALIPDPTEAVREELALILPRPDAAAPLKTVLVELATSCPVLDGGVYSSVIRERASRSRWAPPVGVVAPSLSHALRRLHDSGELELLDRGDAEKTLLSTPDEPVPYSHLVRRAPL